MTDLIDNLFDKLWQDYTSITPSAMALHELILKHTSSSTLFNDHIALRTFDHPKINLSRLAQHFVDLGYQEKGSYDFKAKKLNAKHFEHADGKKPKVFISELKCSELSEQNQQIIQHLIEQIAQNAADKDDFLFSGRHWQVSTLEHTKLAAESEYAAWLAAWGFRANHFTVDVNKLEGIDSLAELNEIIKAAGYQLNTAGGAIKGGEDVCLAQSSTMADKVDCEFSDKTIKLSSCFYEFAQRFKLANGEYYQGFVAASADKIFESTDN